MAVQQLRPPTSASIQHARDLTGQDMVPAGNAARRASSIRIDAVAKQFDGAVKALDGVSLEIEAGEFFTLLGPSGCGKTTLLRILAGLERPSGGRVSIGGAEVTHVPPHRRSVNTVFQSYALFPHLNVRDNIAFGLRMRGITRAERRRRVDEIVQFMHIGELAERRIDQLSGGQRQRIALARALINEPDVLLLDEPLSALDAGLRAQLQVELLRMQKRLGMTFVFVTHDQQEAMVMSDRIAVLEAGRLQQVGEVRDVYERPANSFVARFMGHKNLFPVSAAEEGRLDTPFGRWPISGLNGATGKAYALVRPESVSLEARQGLWIFPARILERLYRGGFTEYRLGGDQFQLTALLRNDAAAASRHEVGAAVTAGIDPATVVFLDD